MLGLIYPVVFFQTLNTFLSSQTSYGHFPLFFAFFSTVINLNSRKALHENTMNSGLTALKKERPH